MSSTGRKRFGTHWCADLTSIFLQLPVRLRAFVIIARPVAVWMREASGGGGGAKNFEVRKVLSFFLAGPEWSSSYFQHSRQQIINKSGCLFSKS